MNIQPLTGSSPLSIITESLHDLTSEYPADLRQRVQQMNQCCPECQPKWGSYLANYKQTLDSITAASNSPWMLHRKFLAAKDTTLNTLVTVSDQQRLKQYLKITTDVRRLPPDKNATSLSVIKLLEPSPEADIQLNRAARHLYSTWLINGPVNGQYRSRISTLWKERNRNYFPENDVIYPTKENGQQPDSHFIKVPNINEI
ncbi:hypothetical protein [Biostraticola tofi]|uniref:Uncharacterized protein n=1 Tax=Biostraticola tofi TaxID=466109 RepID=A0A4R3YLM0_9GAMM|nr:hypothetical protein [Biostraticola tofi]TCV93072.1 hypothetical protein EDC52_110104 [Biostraticola tofi]